MLVAKSVFRSHLSCGYCIFSVDKAVGAKGEKGGEALCMCTGRPYFDALAAIFRTSQSKTCDTYLSFVYLRSCCMAACLCGGPREAK